MPRTPRKVLKRYLNDLKPVKNNLAPTPYSPSRHNKATKQTFGKTVQNGRINQNSLTKKSLYETYKFPEMEFPLDISPRDPFHIGMNFNYNNHVGTLQKARNIQSTAINDLKKEMKMKRKLLSNKQINSESSPLKTEMSSIKFTSYPDYMHLLDSESFPEVQYPLNTMDTWGPNYRSYFPLIQEKKFNGFGQQTLNHQAKEDINKPFTRLTKARASKYLQSYDKLKEEQRRTSTENSKRSNAGQKGLNFTKTATCEKTSDDFMIAGLVSNIPSSPTEIKRTLELTTKIKPSSENTCPVTKYPNHYVPIPYKVIENNTENMCAFEQKNTTKELQDVDTSVIAQTLQLIEKILFHDNTSSAIPTSNYSKEIENNIDSSDCTDVPANEDIPITLMDNAKNFTAEEICQEVPDDAPSGILLDKKPSILEDILVENPTAVESSLSFKMPLQFSEPVEFEAVTNASERDRTIMAPIANSNAVPGSTSIISIPIDNNSDGKSLPHILETTTGTSIIVYMPSTQNSGIPSETQQIVSSSLDNSVPNNELYNVLSNVAPLQNDNLSSTALVSKLLNSISDSGSSLPMQETLPINSMCYNNESTPSSMKEKPVSEILIHKSLTEDASIRTTICDENLHEQPTETDNFAIAILPPTSDFEHPFYDLSGSEFSSLSHGPCSNVFKNESPIITREINSYQQISNVASTELFIPTHNVTPKYLHTKISNVALPQITKDASKVTMNQSFSTLTDSLPEPIIIDEMPPTPLTDTTVEKPLTITTSLSLNPLSETLSGNSDKELMDMKVPPIPISTTDNTSSRSPVVNNSPTTTDMSIKTELFKIRQILDKMLYDTPPDSQTTPMDLILSPILDIDRPMLVNVSLETSPTLSDGFFLPAVDKTVISLPKFNSNINNLGLQVHVTHPSVPAHGTSSDTLALPVDKSLIPSLLLDTADSPPLLIDKTVPPTTVFENPADNKPYFIHNLVTPLSETRTKYTPKNDLSRIADAVPSKMDLAIPNIHELLSDELLHPLDDLPIMVHKEPITNQKSENSTKNLPTPMVEPQNSHSKVPVSDMLYITKELSIPEVLEATFSDISSESETTTMTGYTNNIQQDFSPSIVRNSPEDEKKQTIDLPLSIIPGVFSDAFANEPFLIDDSPSQTNAKIGDFPHTNTDAKDLLSVEDHLLSPEDDANPDTLLINSLSAVSLSTNLDNTHDEELSEYKPEASINLTNPDKAPSVSPILEIPAKDLPLNINKIFTDKPDIQTDDIEKLFSPQDRTETLSSENPADDVLLPTDKVSLPLNTLDKNSSSNKSVPSASKLPITKAILENVLSDITSKAFSLPTASKAFPVKLSSVLDKTTYNLESPLSVINEECLSSVDEIIPSTTLSDQPSDIHLPYSGQSKDSLSLEVDKKFSEVSGLDIPSEKTLMDMSDPTDQPNTKINSSLKLPITKALLENVLSDVTSTEFLKENILPLEEDKKLAEVSSINIPSETLMQEALLKSNVDMTSLKAEILPKETPSDLPSSITKTLSSSKLPIAKALLQNVLSDVTSKNFSLPVSKVLPVKSSSVLDETHYYVESSLSDPTEASSLSSVNDNISNTTVPHQPVDNNSISGQSEETLPLETFSEVSSLDVSSLMEKSNVETLSPNTKILPKDTSSDPPLPSTKINSPSKLLITKTLLENVLSDINTKGFSSPAAKSLPIESRTQLDKTIYYMDSPLSVWIEESFQNDLPSSEINEDVFEQSLEKIFTDNSNLPVDQISEDRSVNLTEEIEDVEWNETFSDNPMDDLP